jgi:hypothetical protein
MRQQEVVDFAVKWSKNSMPEARGGFGESEIRRSSRLDDRFAGHVG